MNKAELIETLVSKIDLAKKQAAEAVETIIDTITSTLKSGGEVALSGFGTFLTKKRAARMGINPKNPSQKVQIPAKTVPKFKPSKTLKDALK